LEDKTEIQTNSEEQSQKNNLAHAKKTQQQKRKIPEDSGAIIIMKSGDRIRITEKELAHFFGKNNKTVYSNEAAFVLENEISINHSAIAAVVRNSDRLV
jgi:hypothetical protein